MPRTGNRNRQEQAEEVARRAAKAAAEAVLEQMDDEEEDEEEMEESIQPGDDGRPKTQKGKKAPAAGGPAKDVKLGSEGPDAVKVGSVQEQADDEEEDEGEEEMEEGVADDQLTATDDSSRIDAQKKRKDPTHSGDIGNEISDHEPIPGRTGVVEQEMAGEQDVKAASKPNPGKPEDQLTDADNDTGEDVRKKGQRTAPGQSGKPSTGSLGAAQDKKELPIDPSAVGLEKTVAEATNALFNGEDLTEEFKAKASTILEAALRDIAGKQEEALTEAFSAVLAEKVAEIEGQNEERQAQLVEKIDDYLGYVVETWLKENEVAIESGIKSEINSSFMKGLHELFTQHNIELPDEKVDAYVETTERVKELEDRLNEQINANVELRKQLQTANLSETFDEVADGLAETQKERLRELSQGIEFDSPEQFRGKLEILKESYFSVAPEAKSENVDESGGTEEEPQVLNEGVAAAAKSLSRLSRNPSPTGRFNS